MRRDNNGWTYSPSDLMVFMESPYASAMERRRAVGVLEDGEGRDPKDALMAMLSKKGDAFEDSVTQNYKSEDKVVVEIPKKASPDALAAATLAAMGDGADVITQAYLSDGQFTGHADYLVRVETPCDNWAWSYEVEDSKLARSVKPKFLLQLSCYSDLLDKLQGGQPEYMTVATGDGERHRYRVAEFSAYYRALRDAFLRAHIEDAAPAPDPALFPSHGNWSETAKATLKARDHLSQVANIRRTQIARLEAAGHTTMQALSKLGADEAVPGLNSAVQQKLSAQARLQKASTTPPPKYEVIEPVEEGMPRGLDALPPHSVGDIFFDLEGHPGEEGGLEYLWGATFFDESGEPAFKDFWGHDPEQEEQAFTDFVDWAYARWQEYPDMHIYHYAAYEITALRKLMGRTGKREDEVDNMLRGQVFVDLFGVVKNGIIVGEPKYSIKNMENLYWPDRGGRGGAVQDGGQSIEVYERWREDPDGDCKDTSELLKSLYDYNKEDCDSTLALTTWLRGVQEIHGIAFREPQKGSRADKSEEEKEVASAEDLARVALADRLIAHPGTDDGLFSEDSLTLLGHTLQFHKREDKPGWWQFFDRLAKDEGELWADYDCIADVHRTKRPPFKPKRARSDFLEYTFDPSQPYKGKGTSFTLQNDREASITIKKGDSGKTGLFISSAEIPDGATLVPNDYIRKEPMVSAVLDVAERALAGKLSSRAIADILERNPPRSSVCVSEVADKRDDPIEFLKTLKTVIRDLDGSAVCIQGPPGAGKTYTASRLISDLVKNGARVGVTSNSHKASDNLLMRSIEVLQDEGLEFSAYKVGGNPPKDDPVLELGATAVSGGSKLMMDDAACLVGGTAWCFAHDNCKDQFDYLFVDEAGQYSLANLIAVSRCAANLVLLGDQMQLSQPTQGVHPGDSGLSCLDYVLNGAAVIGDAQGVFLPASYRMNPSICEVISEQIYEGRLGFAGDAPDHVLSPDGGAGHIKATNGIVWHPVSHSDNEQSSKEEAAEIATLFDELLSRQFHRKNPRALGIEDILVVTPYNAQREVLLAHLPAGARVGTVDLFQGQEAPIVIISLAASSADLAPRGVDFLFSINRLNVAVSRAQALAIIVGSEDLVTSVPNTVTQMRQMNLFCRLREGTENITA